MKIIKQKLLPIITAILMGLGLVAPAFTASPVYAVDPPAEKKSCTCDNGQKGNYTEGAILKYCECGGGQAVHKVVGLVADILSIVIGIAGVIGIVVVGIQYLTAGGNEEQTRKAKRRLFEIIIGIAVYALSYALLKWLLPNFS